MIISLKPNFKGGLPHVFSDEGRLGKVTYDKLLAGESVTVDNVQSDVKEYLNISEGSKPTSSNTVAEIKAYLDSVGTSYDSSASKSELLALV